MTITPAKTQLLPADVKIDLFFIFDGDGRLYTRTFTRRRAMNKIDKGLARQVGPNTIQYSTVFNDNSVTFDPELFFPRDLIILTEFLSGRHADETAYLIQMHNIKAIKNVPYYYKQSPEDNDGSNCRSSRRFNTMSANPFSPVNEFRKTGNQL